MNSNGQKKRMAELQKGDKKNKSNMCLNRTGNVYFRFTAEVVH